MLRHHRRNNPPIPRRQRRQTVRLRRSRNRWRNKALTLGDVMARYETIFENTGTATILIEEDFTISAINDGFVNLMGMPPEAIEGRIQWIELIHADDLERMKHYHAARRVDPDAAPHNYEFRIHTRSRGLREVAITIDMVPGTTQSIASMVDVTDTRRLEREIIAVGERERHRIGRDLHDDLGSHLSGVELLSKVLQKKIIDGAPEAAQEMETIRVLLTEAIEKTRRLSLGLYPVHIVEHGLEASLESLAAEIEAVHGLPLEIVFDPAVERLDNTAASHLYYIVREAVFNAVRHGGPTRIGITVDGMADGFRLRIRDNGRWQAIHDPAASTGGLGLHTMAFRARAMGATFTIDTDENGTCVTLAGMLPGVATDDRHESKAP